DHATGRWSQKWPGVAQNGPLLGTKTRELRVGVKLGGFMTAKGTARFCQARLEDDPELQHELVHPGGSGGGDGGDVTRLTQGAQDLSLQPANKRQNELRRKWYLHSREGHLLPPDVADLS